MRSVLHTTPHTSPPAASLGGGVASADTPVPGGSGATPSGLTAAVEETENSSDEDMFRWTGEDDGLDVGAPLNSSNKSNPFVSLYPSSFHVSAFPSLLTLPALSSRTIFNPSSLGRWCPTWSGCVLFH